MKNDEGEMSMCEDLRQKAWLEHPKDFSMLNLTGTQTTCLMNHQWKAHPSQLPLIWLRVISQMKADIAPGPSGIVVERIRAAGDTGASMI